MGHRVLDGWVPLEGVNLKDWSSDSGTDLSCGFWTIANVIAITLGYSPEVVFHSLDSPSMKRKVLGVYDAYVTGGASREAFRHHFSDVFVHLDVISPLIGDDDMVSRLHKDPGNAPLSNYMINSGHLI